MVRERSMGKLGVKRRGKMDGDIDGNLHFFSLVSEKESSSLRRGRAREGGWALGEEMRCSGVEWVKE
jgi:hypothetical protein